MLIANFAFDLGAVSLKLAQDENRRKEQSLGKDKRSLKVNDTPTKVTETVAQPSFLCTLSKWEHKEQYGSILKIIHSSCCFC